jgi:hypothetical protein
MVNLEKLLPADIPAGEHVLWHGRPRWFGLLRRAFGGDFVALYFGAMTIVNFVWAYANAGTGAAALSAAKTVSAGTIAVALLALLAWLSARTSLYVITDKRLVMKIGIALPIFFNLPFTSIESAAVRVFADGTGDIPIGLTASQRIAYLHLWPHARAFRLNRPEPALRSVGEAQGVAETLSRALIKACNERNDAIGLAPQSVPESQKSTPAYPQGAIVAGVNL